MSVFFVIEFRAEGVVDSDVVELLTHQLQKKGYDWVKINALCNDTVCLFCVKMLLLF
jgi:hexokinase